jgi:hypothetical protein
MRRESRELLMPEPLTPEETEANRQAKLDIERIKLLHNYDDSSDEDENLDYEKVPRTRVENARAGLRDIKFAKSIVINKMEENYI